MLVMEKRKQFVERKFTRGEPVALGLCMKDIKIETNKICGEQVYW